MTADQAMSVHDFLLTSEYDIEARCLPEFTAVWTHFDACDGCSKHGACTKGKRYIRRLNAVAGRTIIHARASAPARQCA